MLGHRDDSGFYVVSCVICSVKSVEESVSITMRQCLNLTFTVIMIIDGNLSGGRTEELATSWRGTILNTYGIPAATRVAATLSFPFIPMGGHAQRVLYLLARLECHYNRANVG